MRTEYINTVTDYLKLVESISTEHYQYAQAVRVKSEGYPLYRGQSQDYPLLPKIARNCDVNPLKQESYLLSELNIRGRIHRDVAQLDVWGLMTLGQHYGLATRLLDWTRNPLIAMWFACSEGNAADKPHVYILLPHWDIDILDREKVTNPQEHKGLSILRTRLEDSRVIAQDGWFTVHSPSRKYGKFVPLGSLDHHAEGMVKIVIEPSSKNDILKNLDTLGVSYQTVFPDLEGVCKYLNWKGEKID